MFLVEPGQDRVIGHPLEDLPQAVGGDAEAEPLLQDLGSLLEQENLEAVANAGDVGSRAVERQGLLADDEEVELGEVGRCVHLRATDSHGVEQSACLALADRTGRSSARLSGAAGAAGR